MRSDRPIAALYVQVPGAYTGLPGVDPWGEARDARRYTGPHPVVAHPPCARWGRYWHGSPSKSHQFALGDDGGCFEAALEAVRRWGGVLEHPSTSLAFKYYGITATPPAGGGWVSVDDRGGFMAQVDQGHYGHVAPKPTWLYVVGRGRPELRWGPSEAAGRVEKMSKIGRAATPPEFRDLLVGIARTPEPLTW